MKIIIAIAALLIVGDVSAQPLSPQDQAFVDAGKQQVQQMSYPAHGWTFNIDYKDPDAIAAAIARGLLNGVWFGGVRYDPLSIYHVDDANGEATRWMRLGVFAASNTEKNSWIVGPHFGLDVAQWTSNAKVAGPIASAAKFWKPLGFASVTASIDVFVAPMLFHTPDIKGPCEYGYGFSIKGKFGGPSDAAALGNSVIKNGL